MRKRKVPGVATKVILDPEVRRRLDVALESSSHTLSGFVQDAIVQKLARHEAPAAFIDRKRAKLGHRKQSGFNLSVCHESGWPLRVPVSFWKAGRPDDEIENLKALIRHTPKIARLEMQNAWDACGLGEFGDLEWEATLQWFRSAEETEQ